MKLSVVIPVYDEKKNISVLYNELKDVLRDIGWEYEIIFVDDGSKDGSLEQLRDIKKQDEFVKIIAFQRNYGQSAALKVGFQKANGDVIVTLDADLQNDPRDIPKLLFYINKGYGLVSGWRKQRQDSFKKKFVSKFANWIRNKITSENIKDTGCMLKAYRREFLSKIKLYNGLHRFLPTLLKLEGAKVIEVEVNHRPRVFGQSKYGIKNRLIQPLIATFIVRWFKKNRLEPVIKEEL